MIDFFVYILFLEKYLYLCVEYKPRKTRMKNAIINRVWMTTAAIVAVMSLCVGCNKSKSEPLTPEQHAHNIATNIGKITVSYYNSCATICEKFIQECMAEQFGTREEARETLEERLSQAEDAYTKKLDMANAEYDAAIDKYRSDVADYNEFIASYATSSANVEMECDAANTDYEQVRKECIESIRRFKPTLPDEERILADLVGQAYYEDCDTGYFWDYSSAIPIYEDSKSFVNITSAQESDLHVIYYATVTTNSYSGGCFMFDFKLTYSLPSNSDDWHLDTMILNNLMPQITDNHNNKVSVECVDPPLGFKRIVLKNNSDSGIVVGITYSYNDGSTLKRAYRLSEYQTETDESVCLYNTPSWKIDFVELL